MRELAEVTMLLLAPIVVLLGLVVLAVLLWLAA